MSWGFAFAAAKMGMPVTPYLTARPVTIASTPG